MRTTKSSLTTAARTSTSTRRRMRTKRSARSPSLRKATAVFSGTASVRSCCTTRKSLRDHFEGFMKRIGWEYDVEPTRAVLHGVTLSEPLKDVRIAVEIESEILQAYAYARSIVPEANRPAAAEFLMRANLGLKRGAFELDMDTGIMRYHTYVDVPLDAGLPSEQTLRNFLLLPVGMFEQYGKSFVEVALGKKIPARAVEEAESLVRGTPDGFPTVIGTAEA